MNSTCYYVFSRLSLIDNHCYSATTGDYYSRYCSLGKYITVISFLNKWMRIDNYSFDDC